MASPLTRTYTPPTCTLEVTAQPSALSRWSSTPVVKSLQFILSLEGLAQGDREPVSLRGDQNQLAALSEAVSSYIQRLVSSRHTDFPLKASAQPESDQTSPTSPTNEGLFGEMEHPVQLQAKSLFTHELILGDLATPTSGSSVVLKVSQLYDLATALEDCAADLQQLPVASPTTSTRRIPSWAKTAAAIAVTAGVGTATWQLLQPGFSPTPQTAQSPTTQKAPQVAIAPPPLPETRQRKSIDLPSVTLPNRSGQSFTIARSNPGDRARSNSDLFSNSQSAAKTATSSQQQSPIKFDPLPPEPSRIPSNIPETAISMRGGNDNLSSTAADQATGPAASGAAVMSEAAPSSQSEVARTSRTRLGNINLFQKAGPPPPAAIAPPMQPAPVPPPAPIAAPKPSEGLFDITPQVLEARRNIESQSQKTAPTRVVEYRLVVNPNGTLAVIEPLGQAAQQYLPKLSLAVGQPFVSGSGQRSQIRLVVRPDGTVQTFPESAGN